MRILVVDDEIGFAVGVKIGLEAESFAVDVAHNGIDGLWRAREVSYDVIILDVMMPVMNGYGVCSALRAEENWTPILLLTANDGARDQVVGLDTGADDYVVKPVEFPVLVARLRALLRRGRPERPVIYVVGDLTVDPAVREVHRGSVPIRLTAREFSVMEFLARNAGRVVSKRDILESVWDDYFDGEPNIVEVYVARLRSKIDRPFARGTISTLRGAGYRLSDHG